MLLKIFLPSILVFISYWICTNALFSSFWEPLYNPRILNYRVDSKFDPDAGKLARDEYQQKYGTRGERLIAEFGSGRTPSSSIHRENDNDVRFYYTYRGANGIQ